MTRRLAGPPGTCDRLGITRWRDMDAGADSADMDVGPCVDTRGATDCGGMRDVAATPAVGWPLARATSIDRQVPSDRSLDVHRTA